MSPQPGQPCPATLPEQPHEDPSRPHCHVRRAPRLGRRANAKLGSKAKVKIYFIGVLFAVPITGRPLVNYFYP